MIVVRALWSIAKKIADFLLVLFLWFAFCVIVTNWLFADGESATNIAVAVFFAGCLFYVIGKIGFWMKGHSNKWVTEEGVSVHNAGQVDAIVKIQGYDEGASSSNNGSNDATSLSDIGLELIKKQRTALEPTTNSVEDTVVIGAKLVGAPQKISQIVVDDVEYINEQISQDFRNLSSSEDGKADFSHLQKAVSTKYLYSPNVVEKAGEYNDSGDVPYVGFVYLLKAGPFYKIGKSKDPEKRIRQIKLQLPYPVEVVHVVASSNMSYLETHWHKRFADKRANGEWFLLTENDVSSFVNQ